MEPIIREFDSLNAYVDHVERSKATRVHPYDPDKRETESPSRESTGHYGRHSWTLGAGFDDAMRLARTGWNEGALEAQRLLSRIPDVTLHESSICATYHDVSGSYVDVGAYVQGEPECMVDFREDSRPRRFARIIVSGFFSAGVDADAITRRGVCIAAIVDALETRGIRCSVELVTANSANTWTSRVYVKHETDPLNLDSLAFAVAHPAMFRRLNFALQEMESPAVQKGYGLADFGSYMHPGTLPSPPDSLVFQCMALDDNWTEENARQRVLNALEKFTGK